MTEAEATPLAPAGRNGALWLGGGLVLLTIILAVAGPRLAPADPLKENYIVVLGQGFLKPPFAPLQAPGFWLGADEYGRDILSRLLWAVQPTVTLALVVAALRLIVGLGLGLAAGWAGGGLGRGLEALIAGAVAAPVLLVALLVIAVTGQSWGVGAFILGMALTGWAETARLVQEQARLVRGQRYVEAARALGASELQILGRHVLPQILPLLGVMLAVEASGALLTSAGLGFLGYFMNAVWLPLGDYTGIRAAGAPELGQMLHFSAATQQPWEALAAGTLVLLIVLGFNLLGAGLRVALNTGRRRTLGPARRLASAGDWVGDQFFLALAEWRRAATTGGAVAGLALMVVGGGWWLWAQSAPAASSAPAIPVPGGHLWASTRHDAQGTLYTEARGPAQAQVLWFFQEAEGLAGPAVAADGTLYLVSARAGGSLLALSPAGRLLWRAAIPQARFLPLPLDSFNRSPGAVQLSEPALTAGGDIVVADGLGNLHTFTPDGRLRWSLANPQPKRLLTSPIVGADGVIYFATENTFSAVGPNGQQRWQQPLPTFSFSQPVLRLSADGHFLLFQDVLASAADGTRAFKAPTSLDLFVAGADGKLYLRKQAEMEEWQLADQVARVLPRFRLDQRGLGLGFRVAFDAGVTPAGRPWFLYSSGNELPKLIWTDASGQAPEIVDAPQRGVQLMAIDGGLTAYLCNDFPEGFQPKVDCAAYQPNGARVWEAQWPDPAGFVVGAALVPHALYVVTGGGALVALGDGPAAGPATGPTSGTPASTETPRPSATTTPNPSATSTSTEAPTVTVTPSITPTLACSNPYIVQRGDWLYKIARLCGVPVQALIAANPGLSVDHLVAGQRLNLPPISP